MCVTKDANMKYFMITNFASKIETFDVIFCGIQSTITTAEPVLSHAIDLQVAQIYTIGLKYLHFGRLLMLALQNLQHVGRAVYGRV